MADERILKKCSDGRDGDLILSPTEGFWSDCPCVSVDPNVGAYEVVDDFEYSAIGDVSSKWMLDQLNSAAALGSAASYGLGGVLVVATGATKNDYANLKAWDSDNAGGPFKITASSGKKLWFAARLYMTAAVFTNEVLYIGLMDGATTKPFADDTGVAAMEDGLYFRTLVASPTELDFARTRNTIGAEIKGNIATVAKDRWITVGFKFDGAKTVIPYINGVAYPQYNTNVSVATFPYDVGLTPYFGILTGAGAAKTLVVDWIKCVQER